MIDVMEGGVIKENGTPLSGGSDTIPKHNKEQVPKEEETGRRRVGSTTEVPVENITGVGQN